MEAVPSNQLTYRIIGAAMRVHSTLGPGLLESIYEAALCEELIRDGLRTRRQIAVPVVYKGRNVASDLRLDILVEEAVIIEVKAVGVVGEIHEAQALSYLRLTGKRLCLVINFNVFHLRNGISRVIL